MKNKLIFTFVMMSMYQSGAVASHSYFGVGLMSQVAREESDRKDTYGSARNSEEHFAKYNLAAQVGYIWTLKSSFTVGVELHYENYDLTIKTSNTRTEIRNAYGYSFLVGYKLQNFAPYLKFKKHEKVNFSHSDDAIQGGEMKSKNNIDQGQDVVGIAYGIDIVLSEKFLLRVEYFHSKPLEYYYGNSSVGKEQRIILDQLYTGVMYAF